MNFPEKLATLRARIAKAESDRDTWRTSGMQDKYLEAYSMVEALELQVDRLRQESLRSFVEKHAPVPVSAPLVSAPLVSTPLVSTPLAGEREQLMAEFAIAYNGRHYQYDRYRYDYLADAVNYARLQRFLLPGSGDVGPLPPPEDVQAPDESQRQLMAASAITFRDGVYHLGPYRYDRLADAVNYARLQLPEET
jgi:hypothetical protein